MKQQTIIPFFLENSRGERVPLPSAREVMESVNRNGDHLWWFDKSLFPADPHEGDWLEGLIVPTYNGEWSEEEQMDVFCTPQWRTDENGVPDTNVRIARWKFSAHDGGFNYDRTVPEISISDWAADTLLPEE